MRRTVLRGLKVLALILILVVLLALGGGYYFLARTFPQTNGALQVSGLRSQVEVVRDSYGVPHIYAANAADLFFAQGYVHAQDRLWQMELNRHVGHGQLAELFGDTKYNDEKTTVEVDQFLRTLGLDRAAQNDAKSLDPETLSILQSYAAGVNAFIHTHADSLPVEFTLLGTRPSDWQPVDSIVWGKVMNYDLGGNYDDELLRSRLIQAVGPEQAAVLAPHYPQSGPFIIPADVKPFTGGTPALPSVAQAPVGPVDLGELDALNRSVNLLGPGIGSNNWVVDGTRTTTGKPLLANDPHLGISMPSIWYMNALHCRPVSESCPFDVEGFSFPAAPGVIIGHNQQIAWGVTNTGPDVQDLYVEKVNPENPNQYLYQGQWQDMELDRETIHVKGGKDVPFTIQYTRHGPVISPVVKGVTATVALQWTATRERSTLFQSVVALDKAQNWDDFRNALRLWDAPSQNFVYADVYGNIGYQIPGRVPIRAKGDGTVPVDGSGGDYEWKGYIPFDDLPFVFNPSSHYIATANNQVVPNGYHYLIALDFAAPYRAQRITDLIKAKDKLSPVDIQQMQGDIYSIQLFKLKGFIARLTPTGFLQQRALKYVQDWDGNLKEDSISGMILEVSYSELVKDLFEPMLGPDLFKSYVQRGDTHRVVIDQLLDDPNNPLWDDPETPSRETRDDRLTSAYWNAVDWLGSQFGDWPPEWHWGRLHTATFAHPFGSIKPLNLIFNYGPVRMPGDGFTLDNSSVEEGKSYETVSSSSMREIVDLSNLDASLWVQGTGESGQPLNPHYTDLTPLWHDIRYAPLLFTRDAVDKARSGDLVLTPK